MGKISWLIHFFLAISARLPSHDRADWEEDEERLRYLGFGDVAALKYRKFGESLAFD
jgi:hypothetical protein